MPDQPSRRRPARRLIAGVARWWRDRAGRWPRLARIGWPVSATLLVRVTMRTIDVLVVGRVLGAAAVAAVGIGDAAARLVLMTALGLAAGTIATVSQATGAGDRRTADEAATQSAVLAVLVGAPLAVVGWVAAPAFYDVLGAPPAVRDLGVEYLRIVIVTAVPRMLAVMLSRAFQATGDTTTPFVVRSVGTAVNIALTVLLVPGLLGLPALGVRGAALGTATGNVVSAAILVALLARGHRSLGFRRSGVAATHLGREIVRIGLPQVVERNLYAVATIPLNAIVLAFGTVANAGFQIGRRVMLYALLPARGVGTATAAMAGNRVGARDPDESDAYARSGFALGLVVSAVVAVPLLFLARPVASLFVLEPDTIAAAATWIRVYAVATVFRGVYGVLRGAHSGFGDTKHPLAATTVGVVAFQLGASALLAFATGLGLVGVYVGVVADPVVRTALLYRWFDQGRWRAATPRQRQDPISI